MNMNQCIYPSHDSSKNKKLNIFNNNIPESHNMFKRNIITLLITISNNMIALLSFHYDSNMGSASYIKNIIMSDLMLLFPVYDELNFIMEHNI